MEEKQQLKKKFGSLIVIMVAIIIPGLVRTLNSSAFESVRPVDTVMLFVTGLVTGVLIITARNYFRLKDKH